MIVDNRTSSGGGSGPVGPQGPKGDDGDPGADGAQGPGGLSAIKGTSPEFSYNIDGTLDRIDYFEGSYTQYFYASGKLDYFDYHEFGVFPIIRKTLIYLGDTLNRIDQTIV